MANYTTSTGAVLTGSTPAVALNSVLTTLATNCPGWVIAYGPPSNASGSQKFNLMRLSQGPDGLKPLGGGEAQGGPFAWRTLDSQLVQSGSAQTLTISTLTAIAPSVGDRVLVWDVLGNAWIPVNVLAVA